MRRQAAALSTSGGGGGMSRAMTDPITPADACHTMAEVRAGVDDVDRRLVALLAERFAFMRAAARIKDSRSSVRDERRKAEVIAAVQVQAAEAGLPADAIARLWEGLVEASIAYELAEWDRTKG